MIEIGSSDASAILGVSPYETPWQCYARLTGMIESAKEPTEVMAWGTRLQDIVLDTFATEVLGISAAAVQRQAQRRRGWMRATPDGVYSDALIEVKCCVGHVPDAPRVDWLVQCLHQALVFEPDRQYLVAFGGLTMTWWEIPRHVKAMVRVMRAEEEFQRRIERGDPPPVRADDASALSRAWPLSRPETVELGDDAVRWDEQLTRASAVIAEHQALRDEAEANLKALIADHQEATLPNGARYRWRPQTRKGYTVEAKTTRPFRRLAGNGDVATES